MSSSRSGPDSEADDTRRAGIQLRLDAHDAGTWEFDRAALVKDLRWLLGEVTAFGHAVPVDWEKIHKDTVSGYVAGYTVATRRAGTLRCECVGGPHGGYTCQWCR